MGTRRRLDTELVRRGLVPSRERAREEIAAGRVLVGGAPTTKPARLVDAGEALRVLGPPPRWVSRAGTKLAAALDHFDLWSEFEGRRVLDAGASTGGFTQCSLEAGAAEVLAVDVGHGQLHERLESDPRVRNLERTNLRTLDPRRVDPPVDVVVGDLSFISLTLVFPSILAVARPGALLVLLIKPQFEAGRREASRGRGVIDDPEIWHRVLIEVTGAMRTRGATIMGLMRSPITGSDGNVEFVMVARAPTGSDVATGPDEDPLPQWIADVVADAALSNRSVTSGPATTGPNGTGPNGTGPNRSAAVN